MRVRNALPALAVLAALLPAHAQGPKEGVPLYKVEINFRDSNDAGAATDRRYSMLVMDSRKAVFKVGSRSPAVSGAAAGKGNATPIAEFTYLDVGVNIECLVQAAGAKAALHGSLDMSDIAGEAALVTGMRNPVIRQTKLDLDAVVEFGKPTVLATIDDPITTRKLEVEATVSKAN